MKQTSYDGKGTKELIVVEPKLKYEGLKFGGKKEVGQCSKVVKDREPIVAKECNPSLKSLAL
jgi:hypothetical protein